MKKAIAVMMISTILSLTLAACGGTSQGNSNSASDTPNEELPLKTNAIMEIAQSTGNTSLDPHKEYFGWNDCTYGFNETLFKIADDFSVQPWLAEKAELEDTTWTITLKDNITFSDGDKVTADMVIRNLERIAEVNSRFSSMADWELNAIDDKTFSITTPKIYVTMTNDLADPSVSIVDLDHTEDIENAPICTGPFVVDAFNAASGDISVKRNENYWGGDVVLAGANILHISDDESRLMAMQNGEIDLYPNVSSSAAEIFEANPDLYHLVITPGARLQYYMINSRLPESVRKAINLVVDKNEMSTFLAGATTPAVGPFSVNVPYGKVTVPETDVAAAKAALEADGYSIGADGFYQKNGEKLVINLSTYSRGSRFLDSLAVIMNRELAAAGIDSNIVEVENPDQYITTGDFDIGFYCMIADKAGDPYYFLNAMLRKGGYLDCMGYDIPEIEELLNELEYETDTDKRAELANKIVQLTIDNNMYGYVGLFNKKTVLAVGVSGFAETSPFDYYGLTADSRKPE